VRRGCCSQGTPTQTNTKHLREAEGFRPLLIYSCSVTWTSVIQPNSM